MLTVYYKGYWMVTNRCNLRCSYCVLENAPHQKKLELDLASKKALVSHLYHKLDFRRLTLSGGEVLIIGKRPPIDFIELLRHIRTFRSPDPSKNLEIEIYTNGTYLNEEIAQEMEGVVDLVAITIDSTQDKLLTELGRNHRGYNKYYEHFIKVCKLISEKGISLKLHSVIGQKNYLSFPNEVSSILEALETVNIQPSCWKFYQYMSYDVPERDNMHRIPADWYKQFTEKVEIALKGRKTRLHFKDNDEMNASLFNILSYGNAQYMRSNDSWSTSQRTADLRTYNSMTDLFAKHDLDEVLFRHYHEIVR